MVCAYTCSINLRKKNIYSRGKKSLETDVIRDRKVETQRDRFRNIETERHTHKERNRKREKT